MKPRHFRFFPDDWIAGTSMLSAEQEGVLVRICALIYSHGGPIPNNDRWLAGQTRLSLRRWRTVRDQLAAIGKLDVWEGHISNIRCERELAATNKRIDFWRESGSKGGRKSANVRKLSLENNGTSQGYGAGCLNHPSPYTSLLRKEGAEAPPPIVIPANKNPTPPTSPAAVIFGEDAGGCLGYLLGSGVKQTWARSLLGKWRKEFGDGAVIDAVTRAKAQAVSDPVPWLRKALAHRQSSPIADGSSPMTL